MPETPRAPTTAPTSADDPAATSIASYTETTEYGQPRTPTTAPTSYGWLGTHQRSTNDLAGLTLMGARLYNPETGRFLTTDPIYGGNNNAYVYPDDPINRSDLDGRKDPGFIAWELASQHLARIHFLNLERVANHLYARWMNGEGPWANWSRHPLANDGRNESAILPGNGARGQFVYYETWDLHRNRHGRGRERLVIGSDGSAWITLNHYRSFYKFR